MILFPAQHISGPTGLPKAANCFQTKSPVSGGNRGYLGIRIRGLRIRVKDLKSCSGLR